MASLGSFGAAVREFDPDGERDTFDFFGETFVVEGVIPSMLHIQLGAALAGKIAEIDGNAALYEVMRCALTKPERQVDGETEPMDESQFDRFFRLAVQKRCDLDDLLTLVFKLFGAQAGRPTEQRPTSPDGSLPTSTNSKSSASDSLASQGYRSVDEVLAG
jgi:hypothetical protein